MTDSNDVRRARAMMRLGIQMQRCRVCKRIFRSDRLPRHWIVLEDADGNGLLGRSSHHDYQETDIRLRHFFLQCSKDCAQAAARKYNEHEGLPQMDARLLRINAKPLRHVYWEESD